MFIRKKPGVSWIVAFLGNPGEKYAATRHNAGFMAADAVERKHKLKISRLRFKAMTALCEFGGEGALLMKPQTWMNLSGESVAPAARFYKLPPERVIVVADDTALPPGKLRVRRSGSSGGHNGLKSIKEHIGSEAFPRVKIGVGAPPGPDFDMVDWVIGCIRGAEAGDIAKAAERAAEAVECIIREGIDSAMNKYN